MTAKKQPCIESVSERKPIDWATLFGALAMGIIAVGTWWNGQQAAKAAEHSQAAVEVAERMEKKVEKVQKQTDGQETNNLKQMAITLENLAAAKPTPQNAKAASEAWDAYETKVRAQEQINNPKSP